MQRCHAISRQGKFPEDSRLQGLACLPTSTPTVCTRRRMGVHQLHNQNSRMERFSKKSYPWCSAELLKSFLENLSMQETLVTTSAHAHLHARTLSGWTWGGWTASGDWSVRAIFLGGNSRGSVPFGNLRFSGGESY